MGQSADKVAQSRQAPESPGIQAVGAIALAFLLYALLADAAIETFASGSSVRWWVAGFIVVYMAASVVLWRRVPRFGWRDRAAASFFVLLGLLACTAWLPAGQVEGIKLVAQPTSTVFAAVTAAAVLVSALVLLRALKPAPLWLRAASGALAAYALCAFAIGIVQHTLYPELLGGASPWRRLPFWLQGAFLGVFVVVPLAVLARLTAVARRMTARGTWTRELGLTLSLASAVVMAVPALTAPRPESGAALAGSSARFAFADERQLEQAVAERLVDEPPPAPADVEPAELIEKAGTHVRSFRPEEWDVGAVAASLGTDPAAAFAFVRDAIGFDPYAGVLRGAEGTLAARSGNSWDRAVLLRALLGKSGLKTRLAFTTLDNEPAARLVKRAYQRPVRHLSDSAPTGLLARAAPGMTKRARRDDAALRLALGNRLDELGVDDGEQVRQEAARHAWVQLQKGDAWVDLDPTLPDAQVGSTLAVASGTAEDVPRDQQQIVVLKVVAQSLTDGRLSESVSLQRELPAAAAARQHLLLAFTPKDEGGGLLRARAKPSVYVPTLWVADETQKGRTITVSSTSHGAGFDSLFGGEGPSSVELAALFIEVETRVPGRPPAIARHVVLDRVPPGARSARTIKPSELRHAVPGDEAAYALGGIHHVMISAGGASALDMARGRLRAIEATVDPAKTASQEPARWQTSPLWTCDLALVEGSERLAVRALDSTGRGRVFVDQPRIFLASWFAEPAGPGSLSRETDLLIDSVRVLPSEAAPLRERAERQMQYGALQSGLETETTLQLAAAWDPVNRTIVSTSLSTRGRLTVLAASDVGRLPAGSASALRTALTGGEFAVVPGEVATAKTWWTVGRSGFVRAIVEPGGGMGKVNGKFVQVSRHVVTAVEGAAKAGSNPGGGGNEQTTTRKVATDVAQQGADITADRMRSAFVDRVTPAIKGMF